MVDEAHGWTDKRIARTERSMRRLYEDAKSRMAEVIADELGDIDMAYDNGELDEESMVMLRLGYGDGLARRLAMMAVDADMRAMELANSQMEDVYRKNSGFMLLVLIGLFDKLNVSKRLDRVTVAKAKVDTDKDFSWNVRRIRSAIMSAPTEEPPSKGSADAVSRVVDMDMRSAMRSARTLATRTEAAARLDAMREAVRAGAKVEKQWVAVMDDRTRETHAGLDGTHVPLDEPFVTFKGTELMYPADPDCNEPSEIYNCRCTLKPWTEE